jgi:hypothetical protein
MTQQTATTDARTPVTERPNFPEYGIEQTPEGMLTWAWAEEQLTRSRNY